MDLVNDNLPMGWELITVADVAELYRGISYKNGDSSNSSRMGFIPILRANNIDDGLNFENLVYVPEHLVSESQLIKIGDIVFAMSSGSKHLVGKSAISNSDYLGSFGAFCGLLRSHKDANSKFLAYFFQSTYFRKRVSEISKGTNINNLKREHILDCSIPFPPINEQHRIVAKIEELFSELDKGVESLTTAREQLKVYRQALLKHAFEGKLTEQWRAEHADQLETADQLLTRIKKEREKRYQEQLAEWEKAVEEWEKNGKEGKKSVKPRKPVDMPAITEDELAKLPVLPPRWTWLRLGDLSVEVFDGPFGSNLKSSDYVDSGIRVIRLENIGPLEFKDENKSFITEEKYQSLKKHTVSAGDIIFSSFVADGNRVVVLPSNIKVAVNKADCFCVRSIGETIFNHYLATFLSTRNAYKQFENQIHGATRPRINTTQLKNCLIPLAPSQEQRKMIDCLNEVFFVIDRLNTEIDQDLKKAVSFRQSILKKAFAGELVPQDPTDEPASELLARIKAEREDAQQQAKKTPRKAKKKKEVITMADLMEVMKGAKDWMSAQEAFRQCGIADGAETDAIEKIYQELRDYEKQGKVAVERRGEEDWLCLAQGA